MQFKNGTINEWYEHIGAVFINIWLSLFSLLFYSSNIISPLEKSILKSNSFYSILRNVLSFSLKSLINSVSGS